MGKLTSLLKKKKSRGDGLTSSDLQEKTGSTLSGISVEAAPLSLSIPATTMGEGTSSDLQASFSLMDDIMDELAGTTPDTPQPTLASSSSDFSDFGLAFELSRQLDQGITSTEKESGPRSVGQAHAAASTTTTTTTTTKIGKLEQNRAFKDNAFLRNQQQLQSRASSNTTNSSSIPSTQARRLSEKKAEEIERAAEAAARLREASKKANAQLPSDDEGSSSSESDGSDDELSPRRRRQQQQQQKLLQMQQQQQAMLQLQQQQLPYHAGESFVGNTGSPRRSDGGNTKKPQPINHEAVIDRMKDRHRALLVGAAAAARDEYYEEYMDEYGLAQPLQAPGSMMAYNMQYGVDPAMMYGMDEFRMKQQQQQQQYFGQGALPSHPYGPATPPLSTVLPAGYNYTSVGPTPVGYNAAGAGVYPGQPLGFAGPHGPAMHPQQHPGFAREYGSDVSSSHSNSVNNGETMMPTRQRFRQQSTASSARASEDSWADPYPVLLSAGKSHSHESGPGGIIMAATLATTATGTATAPATQQAQCTSEDSMLLVKDATLTPEDDLESEKADAAVDEMTQVVEGLSIAAQAEGTDTGAEADTEDAPDTASSERDEGGKEEPASHAQTPQLASWSNGSSETFEVPEGSLKGSTTANESGHYLHDHHQLKEVPSSTMSAHDQESHDSESSDDDQPIILSRRGSARGPFPFLMPTKTHMEYPLLSGAGADGLDDVMPVSTMMMGGQQQQVPCMMPQSKTTYHQPGQVPPNNSNGYAPQYGPFVPQQQPQPQPQQYMSMGYPYPGSHQPVPAVANLSMGHHHSYSMDRIPGNMMMGSIGNTTMAHNMARRGHTMPYVSASSSGPKDLRQAAMTASGYGAVVAPIQSPYPIPPTTLLHPLPRRTQSARLRSQNPVGSSSQQLQQQQQQYGLPPSAMMRGRNSLEYARCLPNGNYQAVPSDYMNGGNGGSVGGGYMRGYGEPLASPPQQYQQQLQMQYQQGYPFHQQPQQHQQQQPQGPMMTASPPQSHSLVEMQQQQQQHQQGSFVANSHFGYGMHSSEAYMSQPHQQPILQAVRR